jgi:hypothetical protein
MLGERWWMAKQQTAAMGVSELRLSPWLVARGGVRCFRMGEAGMRARGGIE